MLPLVAVVGLFAYYPALSAFFHSAFEWNPGSGSTFVGADNYRQMLQDAVWWHSFRNLGVIFVFNLVTWIFPLLAAELLITLKSRRWQFAMRTLLIVPMAFPGVVTALIWGFFYDPNTGVFNQVLAAIGLESLQQNWTGSPNSALISLLLVGFPFIGGLPFLVFYSGLNNIPREIFEAAALDGLGRWGRLWRVDLPLIAGQLRVLLFLVVVGTFQYGFVAYVLTQGGPDNATVVPLLWTISQAFTAANWGYAAALSAVLFTVTLAFSAVIALHRRRETGMADGGRM
nr:sugar ABC transporter permease [Kribbella sandramycini]